MKETTKKSLFGFKCAFKICSKVVSKLATRYMLEHSSSNLLSYNKKRTYSKKP